MKKEFLLMLGCIFCLAGCNEAAHVSDSVAKQEKEEKTESSTQETDSGVQKQENIEPLAPIEGVSPMFKELSALDDSARRFSYIHKFACNRAMVVSNKKYGFIDTEGRLVIKPEYDYSNMSRFSNGLIAVKKDGNRGVIDTLGRVVVPFQYYDIKPSGDETMLLCTKNSKYSFFDQRSGRIIDLHQFREVHPFRDGMARVRTDEWNGYIDRNFNVAIKGQFKHRSDFADGMADVTDEKGERYFIDKSGKRFETPADCKVFMNFNNGYAMLYNGKKYGIIDKNSRVIIEPQYSCPTEIRYIGKGELDIIPFAFQGRDSLYFYDKNANITLAMQNDIFGHFAYDGEFFIGYNDEEGAKIYRRNGERLFAGEDIALIDYFGQDLFYASKEGKNGIVNSKGEILLPFCFNFLMVDFESKIIVGMAKNGEYRFFQIVGELLMEE